MKNIIIVGPSRSGKSTLAKRINEELGFFVLSTDKLVAIFENAYPNLDIRLNWDRDKTTENLAPFLGHFLGMFSADDGKGLLDYSHGTVKENHFVLEGAYYDFEKVENILKLYGIENIKDRFHLIGLVQREKSADDFYSDFKKFDTEEDWTYSLSDDELKNVSEEAVSYNEEMYEKLTEYGFDIYDTSKDRDKVYAEILERIKENE
ncbi:hypothetical protein [Eubacterium sp.]|uniref:hypothetical protein n=1 Tax=Eubacterium sp. TaxID=142586 RepID=UPI0025FDF2DB|nr:hypothetical protein [Eubacterium sp.]MCR5629344.1 hypothetical protein [Eubacterium sp.]